MSARIESLAGGMGRRIWPRTVTAIVSTYRAERFIAGCLENLVGQSLFALGEMEILVIDSGSPEREGAIVREFQQRFGRNKIRYRRTRHETIYASWNRAVRLARGRYLTNANTDDRRHPDGIRRQAEFLDANPALGGCYGFQRITEVPNANWEDSVGETGFAWPEFSYAELQRRCIVGSQPMWRRSLHDKYGFFDDAFRVVGDYDFWLRVTKEHPFGRIPEILGVYYRNPDGLELNCPNLVDESVKVRRRHGILEVPQGGTIPQPMAGIEGP